MSLGLSRYGWVPVVLGSVLACQPPGKSGNPLTLGSSALSATVDAAFVKLPWLRTSKKSSHSKDAPVLDIDELTRLLQGDTSDVLMFQRDKNHLMKLEGWFKAQPAVLWSVQGQLERVRRVYDYEKTLQDIVEQILSKDTYKDRTIGPMKELLGAIPNVLRQSQIIKYLSEVAKSDTSSRSRIANQLMYDLGLGGSSRINPMAPQKGGHVTIDQPEILSLNNFIACSRLTNKHQVQQCAGNLLRWLQDHPGESERVFDALWGNLPSKRSTSCYKAKLLELLGSSYMTHRWHSGDLKTILMYWDDADANVRGSAVRLMIKVLEDAYKREPDYQTRAQWLPDAVLDKLLAKLHHPFLGSKQLGNFTDYLQCLRCVRSLRPGWRSEKIFETLWGWIKSPPNGQLVMPDDLAITLLPYLKENPVWASKYEKHMLGLSYQPNTMGVWGHLFLLLFDGLSTP